MNISIIEKDITEIELIKPLWDKLMNNALKWFKSNGIKNIEINVVYTNDEALPFYEKHGFHIGNYILKTDHNVVTERK